MKVDMERVKSLLDTCHSYASEDGSEVGVVAVDPGDFFDFCVDAEGVASFYLRVADVEWGCDVDPWGGGQDEPRPA